ncbi:MAG TPA: pyrroline-5-carboxylate reductase [Solirubrobacteraceae bacterium]|jgi:pyrroline-5-carboxylate reductase|nr:pyrroline-5-carboxylate reductase [Solirubrobacteraceae bacterium]
MQIGLVGSGNMARALARGWGEPVLCTDSGSGRAQALVDELGGEHVASNRELAERVDLVVLCHKPYHLQQVADEIAPAAKAVASVLGATPTRTLQRAYQQSQVFALMPNTPVEIRQGVVIYAQREPDPAFTVDAEVERQVLALFERLGKLVTVPERLIGTATAVTGVGPAYQALLAEAQVDAAVRHGLGASLASELVTATMIGSAALIEQKGYDTLAVRREVTSPGGSTARGLDALERAGVRTAFQDAIEAVVNPGGTR